jgi:transposase-like protein
VQEATTPSRFQPDLTSKDAITEVLRRGARRLLAIAFEDEVEAFVAQFADARDEHGRRAVVRNGYLPERELVTGIGPVAIEQPRVRVRSTKDGVEIPKFTSKLLPPYLRKTKSIEELIPWLYLKGISTDDDQEALAALLGPQAPGLSATTIVRIKSKRPGAAPR